MRGLRFVWVLVALSASVARAQYVDLPFDSITDEAKCGPPQRDAKGKPFHYLKIDEGPGAELLADLQRVLQRMHFAFYLANDPLPKPAHMCLGYFDDSAAPNAFAAGPVHLVLGVTLMSSLLDEGLLRRRIEQHLERHGQNPTVLAGIKLDPSAATTLVVAHEFAHNLQARHKLSFAGPTVRDLELHADCSAAFLMTFFSGAQAVSNEEARRGAQFLSLALGDHHFDSQSHHGTPAERLAAVKFGMLSATATIIDGWEESDLSSGAVMAICSQKYPTVDGPLKVPTTKPWIFRDVDNTPVGTPAAAPKVEPAPKPQEPVTAPKPPPVILQGLPKPTNPTPAPVILRPLPTTTPASPVILRPLPTPVLQPLPRLRGLDLNRKPSPVVLPPLESLRPTPVLKGLHLRDAGR